MQFLTFVAAIASAFLTPVVEWMRELPTAILDAIAAVPAPVLVVVAIVSFLVTVAAVRTKVTR